MSAWLQPLSEWDARSIWFFHGKALFVHSGVAADFFTNDRLAWSHLDYPLFLPVQAAWCCLFHGEWNEFAAKSFLFFNFAAYATLVFSVLRRRLFPAWIGFLFTAVLLDLDIHGYVNGLADNHYSIGLVIGLLLMSGTRRRCDIPLLLLCLGFSAEIKNEGAALAVLLSVLLLGYALPTLRSARSDGVRRFLRNHRAALLLVLLVGVVPTGLWSIFKWTDHITGDFPATLLLTRLFELPQLLAERLPAILSAFRLHHEESRLLVPLVILVGITVMRAIAGRFPDGRALRVRRYEAFTWIFFGAVNVVVILAFVVTPQDVHWHLDTALRRLLHLPFLVLLLIGVYTAEALFRAAAERGVRLPGISPAVPPE